MILPRPTTGLMVLLSMLLTTVSLATPWELHPDRVRADNVIENGFLIKGVPHDLVGDGASEMLVTDLRFVGKTGWAIHYGHQFVLRSDDAGRSWYSIGQDADFHMPWGLAVSSDTVAWVWGQHTTETLWQGTSHAIHRTDDGGATWHAFPEVVMYLYNVEIIDKSTAIVIGRNPPMNAKPDDNPDSWPQEHWLTTDAGLTFKQLR